MVVNPSNLDSKAFMKMEKIKVIQVRSTIGCNKRQKATVQALGLKKINHSVEHNATPQILGMIAKVDHLVKVESAS